MADAAPLPQMQMRAYELRDLKELRLLMGQHAFEQLPVANRQMYTHPLTIGVWVGLSAAIIQYFNWWPIAEYGFISYLSPLRAFAMAGVPILFAVDWYQRPFFEKALRALVSAEDMIDIETYYSSARSPFTKFILLIWNDRPIGYIGVDASSPDEEFTSLEEEEKLEDTSDPKVKRAAKETPSSVLKDKAAQREKAVKNLKAKMAARVKESAKVQKENPFKYAVVRHFHVDRIYERTDIQFDLIRTVLGGIFNPSTADEKKARTGGTQQKIEKVYVRVSSLEPEALDLWRKVGFTPSPDRNGWDTSALGGLFPTLKGRALAGEKVTWYETNKVRWESIGSLVGL